MNLVTARTPNNIHKHDHSLNISNWDAKSILVPLCQLHFHFEVEFPIHFWVPISFWILLWKSGGIRIHFFVNLYKAGFSKKARPGNRTQGTPTEAMGLHAVRNSATRAVDIGSFQFTVSKILLEKVYWERPISLARVTELQGSVKAHRLSRGATG